ncbi:hypothetical protein ACFTWP_18040, partial [Kitasatospora sp. NPDC057015]
LPLLPRRKPAGQAAAAAPAAPPAAEPAGPDGAVAEAPQPTAGPAGEPDRRHDRADERIPAQQRGEPSAREHGPVPEGADVTPLGLPRRIPRGNGLPGTGETPTSGLRRLAVEDSTPARTGSARPPATVEPARPQEPALPGRPGPGPADAAAPATGASGSEQHAPARSGVSPEELRRRLGVFQGGLRRAARDSALAGAGRPDPTRPAPGHPGEDRPVQDLTAAPPSTSPTAGPHPSADRPTTARPTVAPLTDRPGAPADEQRDPAAEGENR